MRHNSEHNPLLLLRRVQALQRALPELAERAAVVSEEKLRLMDQLRESLTAATAATVALSAEAVVAAPAVPDADSAALLLEPTLAARSRGAGAEADAGGGAENVASGANMPSGTPTTKAAPKDGGAAPASSARRAVPRSSSKASSAATAASSSAAASTSAPKAGSPVTEAEFAGVPDLTRGRCTFDDVTTAYDVISTHFSSKAAAPRRGSTAVVPLSLQQLDRMGARVGGRTGQCVLNTLRVLGRIQIVRAGVMLPQHTALKAPSAKTTR